MAFARRLAASLVGGDAAEDVVQEAWRAMLDRPPRHAANLRAYLATLVHRLALRRRRAEGRRASHERQAARDEDLPSSADLVARIEIHGRLVAAVLALDEPYRGTVLLRFFEDLAPAEIARRQGVPVETVRTRLKRALARLRADLAGGDETKGSDWLGALVGLAGGARAAKLSTATRGALPSTALGLGAVTLLTAGAWWAFLALRSAPPLASAERALAQASGPARSGPSAALVPLAAEREAVELPPAPSEGQRASPEPEAQGPEWPRILRGRVLDPGGLGIGNALVVASEVRLISFRPVASARTEADGRYALPLDALARLSWSERASRLLDVSVEAAGFQPTHGRISSRTGSSDIVRDWTLEPGRMLVGRVIDEEGEPLDHAIVWLRLGPASSPAPGARYEAVDAAGVFRVPLAEGQVPIEVQGWSHGRYAGRLAPELLIAREEHARLELAPLVLGRGAGVEGRVSYPDGSPASGVSVTAQLVQRALDGSWIPVTEFGVRDGGLTSGGCRSGPDGRFRILGLRAGSYRLDPTGAADEPGARVFATGCTDAELTIDEHRLLLSVVDQDGRALDEIPVAFTTEAEPGAARAPVTLRMLTNGDPPTASHGVRPGSSVVLGAYVPGAPPVEERIVVPELPYETAHTLTVGFRPATAALVVRMEGVQPGTRARVRLFAERSGVVVGPPRTTDEAGRVDGLSAGRWRVEIDPLPAPGALDCHPALRLEAALALEPGVTSEVAVAVGSGAPLAIAFAVGSEDPRPRRSAPSEGSLDTWALDTWITWSTGTPGAELLPDGDAAHALDLGLIQPGEIWESDGALPAGRWLLHASLRGFLPVEQWLTIEPCRAAALRVELVPDATGR